MAKHYEKLLICDINKEKNNRADGGAFSCFEKISKPNVEIYKKLIEKYKLDIEKSILIDDTKRNIISDDDIGFKGILFSNIEDIKEF